MEIVFHWREGAWLRIDGNGPPDSGSLAAGMRDLIALCEQFGAPMSMEVRREGVSTTLGV